MRRINSNFLFLLLNFLTISSFGHVIWNEGFDLSNKGIWGDADGETVHVDFSSINRWTLNYDSCHFSAENDYVKTVSTSGGRLEALDCDGEAIWYSNWIDISRYSDIKIELTARETGSGTNPDKKYLKAYYQLNNQDEVLFGNNGINEANWGVAKVSQDKLNGDSIRIVVHLNSSYANDKVILDDVRVSTDQPEIIDESQLISAGDVLINEVLFDPYPGGVDFIELYNQSGKAIRLDHLFLANRNGNADLGTVVQLTKNELLFEANSYLVLSEDSEKVLVFYTTNCPKCFLNLDKLPAYNNNFGDVVLLNDSLKVIDEMHYSSNMHDPLLVNEEGVSLERISFDELSFDPLNWASAKASVHFATPGYQNSMAESLIQDHDMVSLEPKSFSPNNDGYNDYLNITYQFENPNSIANLKIFDSHGAPVCDLVKNERTGSTGKWIWNGRQKDGQRCRLGMYIVMLELNDGHGTIKQFKKACSITDRLE